MQALNQLSIARLVLKFRNAHAICMKGRPYTDYLMLCDLDQAKGSDIGTQYRTDKAAPEFASFIAESERNKIREKISCAKFVAGISDGSTDSSHQEAEIVYCRCCHSGNISVFFSLVKNSPKADAEPIAKIILAGVENLAKDYKKQLSDEDYYSDNDYEHEADELSDDLPLTTTWDDRQREATRAYANFRRLLSAS